MSFGVKVVSNWVSHNLDHFVVNRDDGGAFGRMEAAHEELYFKKLVRTYLEIASAEE